VRFRNSTLVKSLRWVSAITTVIYLAMFVVKLFSRYRTLDTTGVDIDWSVPANPQSMIALCLVTGTIALVFLRSGGIILSTLLFGGVIGFYVQWALLTKAIRFNTDMATIPQQSWLGNILIGAGVVDVFVLVLATFMFFAMLLEVWRQRESIFNLRHLKQELHLG